MNTDPRTPEFYTLGNLNAVLECNDILTLCRINENDYSDKSVSKTYMRKKIDSLVENNDTDVHVLTSMIEKVQYHIFKKIMNCEFLGISIQRKPLIESRRYEI